ncbi:MAG: DUF3617 domain-containing protein [Sphingopyxis sp.]
MAQARWAWMVARAGAMAACVAACVAVAGCDAAAPPSTPSNAERGNGVGAAAIRAELAQAARMTPGQYSNDVRITRFDVPGLPAEQAAMLRDMMSGAVAVESQYCLSAQQADRGSQDMFREMAKGSGDCRFDHFDVADGQVNGRLQCNGRGESSAVMTLTGTLAADGSAVTMVTDIRDSSMPQGKAQIEMRVTSRRTGACVASGATPSAAPSATPSAAVPGGAAQPKNGG